MTRGIVYIATGESVLRHAIRSAKRVSDVSDFPITLITDASGPFEPVDEVKQIESPHYDFRDKVENFHRAPYDECIYLDSDTWVCDGTALDELFSLLEMHDVAAKMDIGRRIDRHVGDDAAPEPSAPQAFSEPNTGVVVYDSKNCQSLFAQWREVYRKHYDSNRGINDQGAFHEAVYKSNVNYGVFPPEYNFRLIIPHYLRQSVKILHGKADNYEEIANIVNNRIEEDGEIL